MELIDANKQKHPNTEHNLAIFNITKTVWALQSGSQPKLSQYIHSN